MYLLLKRYEEATHCRGDLFLNGTHLCKTLELPNLDNANNVSCIPEGIYDLAPHNTKKFPETFRVLKVPNREAILIHTGNKLTDIQGCILVGTEFKGRGKDTLILNSKHAMNILRRKLQLPAELEIQICQR